MNIVVLQAEERQFGLVVDAINDTEEIVVKPLGKQLKGIKTFAGATIMGDGRVALILDVLGLAQPGNVVGESRERTMAGEQAAAGRDAGKETMLLLHCGPDGRVAMELSLVARLEEFKAAAIEKAGDCDVVQYRGQNYAADPHRRSLAPPAKPTFEQRLWPHPGCRVFRRWPQRRPGRRAHPGHRRGILHPPTTREQGQGSSAPRSFSKKSPTCSTCTH